MKTYRFGVFELDAGSWQLRKQGYGVRLQEQPLRLLFILLEHSGGLVTREELRSKLWPSETFVEFDDSLNTAVQKIRRALQDDAKNPRFVETVPRQGYRFIAPVHVESEQTGIPNIAEITLETPDVPPPSTDRPPHRKVPNYLPWMAIAAVLAGSVIWFASVAGRQPASGPLRLSITPPAGVELRPGITGGSAISPDGQTLAFVARREGKTMLWTRRLDSLVPHELPGTENARLPFWSPDSKSIGFMASGKLRRIDLAGGPPQDLAIATRPARGSWGEDGTILFSTGIPGPLYRVSETGGTPSPVTLADNNSVLWPHWIAGTDRFLFFDKLQASIRVGSVSDINQGSELFKAQSNGVFSPPYDGNPAALLWMEGTRLVAQRFDEKRGRLLGSESTTVVDQIGFSEGWGLVDVSVSRNGILVAGAGTTTARHLVWLRRDGTVVESLSEPDWFKSVRLSRDGNHAAVARGLGGALWIKNFQRDVLTRLTFEKQPSGWPVWSPDGRQIAYSAERGGPLNVFLRPSGGAMREERLTTSPFEQYVYDWSPDGRHLVYCEVNTETKLDLWILPIAGDRKPYPLLKTTFNEDMPRFSSDGKWIAYVSDESGRNEVYVMSFPGLHRKWQISTAGGTAPMWCPDCNELFYLAGDGYLTSVPFTPRATEFEWLAPRRLFVRRTGGSYDVGPGGKTFLALRPIDEFRPNELIVVLNWQSTLRK